MARKLLGHFFSKWSRRCFLKNLSTHPAHIYLFIFAFNYGVWKRLFATQLFTSSIGSRKVTFDWPIERHGANVCHV